MMSLPKVRLCSVGLLCSCLFQPDSLHFIGIENESSGSGSTSSDDPLVLPDIKDMLKKKELQQEEERLEQEQQLNVKKIKRSDTKAFTKVSLLVVRDVIVLLSFCSFSSLASLSCWNHNPMPMPTIPFLKRKNMAPSVPCWERVRHRFWGFHPAPCKWGTLLVPW